MWLENKNIVERLAQWTGQESSRKSVSGAHRCETRGRILGLLDASSSATRDRRAVAGEIVETPLCEEDKVRRGEKEGGLGEKGSLW